MIACKITVIKRPVFTDLVDEYLQKKAGVCPNFTEGQEFIAGYEKPEGFCDWAWNDLQRYIVALLCDGNFSHGMFSGWMKDPDSMIACCTDGIRPVVFKLEKVGIEKV